MSSGRVVWQYVDRDDPHDSGWWQLARVIQLDDGTVEIETNTRGSVVPTTLKLSPEAVRDLAEKLPTVVMYADRVARRTT